MSELSGVSQQPTGAENFIPLWEAGNRSFDEISFSLLKRKRSSNNEYYVYSDEETFKTVEADSAVKAIEASEIKAPFKVQLAHCRMPYSICGLDLEFAKMVSVSVELKDDDEESQYAEGFIEEDTQTQDAITAAPEVEAEPEPTPAPETAEAVEQKAESNDAPAVPANEGGNENAEPASLDTPAEPQA